MLACLTINFLTTVYSQVMFIILNVMMLMIIYYMSLLLLTVST